MTILSRRGLAPPPSRGCRPRVLRAQAKTILRIGWTSGDGAQDPYAVGARAFQKALAAASASGSRCSSTPTAPSATNGR